MSAALHNRPPGTRKRATAAAKTKRSMTKAQRAWCERYEHHTTFEPLMDDFLEGNETFVEAAKGSLSWFRDWFEEAERAAGRDIPGADQE
jgi:hypothetical protein